ncbi:MAG TPA: hypothetical protein VJQ84_02835 [Solirubrobacterales bacterium]|nr:hypothetical protein [Solirubrobacterales bacterium]
MGTMLDTVDDPQKTFAGLKFDAVAAYGNGKYANFKAAKKEFPDSHVLEIDVTGEGIGNVGDFELGDIPYSKAGSWAKGRLAAGVHRPVIYFSASRWGEIMQSLKAAGVSRKDVRIWTAHYTGKEHVCSSKCGFGIAGKADATQWGSPPPIGKLPAPYAGRNVDVSKTAPSFFAGEAAAKPATAKAKAKASTKAAAKGKGATKERVAAVEDKVVHRPLGLSTPFMKGPDVLALQEAVKGGLNHYKVDWVPLETDGEYGPQSVHAAAFYGWMLGMTEASRRKLRKTGSLAEAIQEVLRNPEKRGDDYRERAEERKERLKEMRKAHKQGPKAAVAYAKAMIGVTENPAESNSGPDVTRRGKKGGITFWEQAWGLGSCYWCLCFASYCVKLIGGAQISGNCCHAGEIERMARARTNGWIAVPASEAKAGDIALYNFEGSSEPDHGELVVGPLKNGMFNDVGGNTSSDSGGSQNNGGGVYAKLRDPSLLTCIARPLY